MQATGNKGQFNLKEIIRINELPWNDAYVEHTQFGEAYRRQGTFPINGMFNFIRMRRCCYFLTVKICNVTPGEQGGASGGGKQYQKPGTNAVSISNPMGEESCFAMSVSLGSTRGLAKGVRGAHGQQYHFVLQFSCWNGQNRLYFWLLPCLGENPWKQLSKHSKQIAAMPVQIKTHLFTSDPVIAPVPDEWLQKVFSTPNTVLLESNPLIQKNAVSYLFHNPEAIITLTHQTSPGQFFNALHSWLQQGYYLAGFLTYEAGYLMDEALPEPSPGVLGWFGVFRTVQRFRHQQPKSFPADPELPREVSVHNLKFQSNVRDYQNAIHRIREHIGRGDVYQINFTAPLTFTFEGTPEALYRQLRHNQPVAYHAVIHLPDRLILSFSPELFFAIDGQRIITRPMKGTHPRGRFWEEDEQYRHLLQQDIKSQAENVMITDLLRNDLGRICQPGSVVVNELCAVERYPTVLQMISQVEGLLRPGVQLEAIFRSLFPCGSVTGAPKIRAMQIIREVENQPRGVYTGTIGFLSPDGTARFSVAIRTIELQGKQGRLGVGGGIVWDSNPDQEYQECLLKARFLTHHTPDFALLETMRWEDGFPFLPYHLERLTESARYFGFPLNMEGLKSALQQIDRSLHGNGAHRIRLLLHRWGNWTIEVYPLLHSHFISNRIALASDPVNSEDRFLYHKTTYRPLFNRYREIADHHQLADILFLNERGEITQGTITNLFLLKNGQWKTPPITSGLLNGVFRRHFINTHSVEECPIFPDDLHTAEAIYIGNALRGLHRVFWNGETVGR